MKKILFTLSAAILLLASCKKDDHNYGGIFKSQEKNFQQGKVVTWVQLDKSGKPEKLAITIDAAAMNSLDPGNEGPDEGEMNSLSIGFPNKAGVTPFTHALLEWNPHGHEPAGIYDKPHFDFHFYMQSEGERLQIPPYGVDSSKFLNFPAMDYLPANYFTIPGGVPEMGTHWVDVTSPELHGALFTQTFIYGTYDGKVTFYEPMMTKAFIDANSSFERPIPAPAKFKTAGYYPTKMTMSTTQGAVTVTLENFVYRQAS